jgi:hypothetical protein
MMSLMIKIGEELKNVTGMTPQKREQYAEWLRNTGVEHPSDELIAKTRERALLQIDTAQEKARRSRLTLVALVLCFLVLAVCVWFRI